MKACCGFGHRDVFENITTEIEKAVKAAIHEGCEIFYTGAMGQFDRLFSSAVRKMKKDYPNIKLICVKPYFTQELNENKDYYASAYDDVIIPTEIIGIHYKGAIKARNRWMINRSDIVLVYTIRDYGGAYEAKSYAQSQGKRIHRIASISLL